MGETAASAEKMFDGLNGAIVAPDPSHLTFVGCLLIIFVGDNTDVLEGVHVVKEGVLGLLKTFKETFRGNIGRPGSF